MKAFLTGFAVGVGLGVLFAPDSGQSTRANWRRRYGYFKEQFTRQVQNLGQGLRERESGRSRPPQEAVSRVQKKEQGSEKQLPEELLINRLTREELMEVNGIGPVLAERIISGRPYASLGELLERGILSQGTFRELERDIGTRFRNSA